MHERGEHINFQSGRWLQILGVRDNKEKTAELYQSFKELPWAETVLDLLDEDLIVKLQQILSWSKSIRTQFFYDSDDCVKVLQVLKQSGETDEEVSRNVVFKLFGRTEGPAQGMASYLEVIENPELRSWFGLNDTTNHLQSLGAWNGKMLAQFLRHPDRDMYMKAFSFYRLSSFLYAGVSLEHIFNDTELFELLRKKELSWTERVQLLTSLSSIVGTLDRPYTQLCDQVWEKYVQVNPQASEQSTLEQTKQSMIIVNRLQRTNAMATQMDKLNLPPPVSLRDSLRDSAELTYMDQEEYDYRIMKDVQPTIGFEWEFKDSLWNGYDQIKTLLEVKGIHIGSGGGEVSEISPGPFYTPEAAQMVAHVLYESGIINPYQSIGNSIHWNVGLASYRDVSGYVAWLQSTGWCYHPYKYSSHVFNNDGAYSHKIHANMIKDVNKPFVEMKSFNFQGIDSFKTHIEMGSHLGTALAAYQKVMQSLYEPNDKLNSTAYNTLTISSPFLYVTDDMVEQTSVSPITKQLARVWIRARMKIGEGFNVTNISEMLEPTPTAKDAQKFAKQLWEVFPNKTSINDRTDEFVFNTNSRPFYVGDELHPNVVAFSRSVAYEVADEVSHILDYYQDKALRMIEYIGDQKKPDQIAVRNKYYQDFPSSMVKGVSRDVADTWLMSKLYDHYFKNTP